MAASRLRRRWLAGQLAARPAFGPAEFAPMTLRLLVCGGRDFAEREMLERVLDNVAAEAHRAPVILIHGGARGADELAGEWAMRRGHSQLVFKADWKRYGRAAGPKRNQQMLDQGKPDLVVAFAGGRGTADMVRRAQAASIPTMLDERLNPVLDQIAGPPSL